MKSLGGSVATVLLIYLAYNISYAVLSYPAGRLSDVIGRRRVLVPGYIIYAAVYFLAARATELSEMWALFIVYGFYQALTQGVERAIIADFSTPSTRGAALGAHAMLTGIGLFLPRSWRESSGTDSVLPMSFTLALPSRSFLLFCSGCYF